MRRGSMIACEQSEPVECIMHSVSKKNYGKSFLIVFLHRIINLRAPHKECGFALLIDFRLEDDGIKNTISEIDITH